MEPDTTTETIHAELLAQAPATPIAEEIKAAEADGSEWVAKEPAPLHPSTPLASVPVPAPVPTPPTIGRLVHYALSAEDCEKINDRRAADPTHGGNTVRLGDVVPMIVISPWGGSENYVNGQALLDGDDSFWVTSRPQGDKPGQWSWPPRV